MKKYDVLIIGAGPAGLMAALKLSKKGQRVAILDRLSHIKRKVCGEYLCPKGVDLLKKEKLSQLLSPFPSITGMNLFSPKGKKIEAHFLRRGAALNRQNFDNALCEQAISAGVDIYFNQQVSSLSFDQEKSVHIITTLNNEEFQAPFLIGADGRSSFVAKHFDLTKNSDQKAEKKIALHLHTKTCEKNSRQGEMHLFTNGDYIGLDPSSDSSMNITLVCHKDKLKTYSPYELIHHYLNFSHHLKNRFLLSSDDKIEMVFPLGHHTNSVITKNVALVGDAASFIDPLTGEGIYQALLSGLLLAQEFPHLENYAKSYKKMFEQKKYLNTFFQFFIRRDFLIEAFASLLQRSKRISNIFINVIGNIYSPIEGILKVFFLSRR